MINIFSVLLILFIHWIADFVLQTHWQATNKSKNPEALLEHTVIYSVAWLVLFPGLRYQIIPFILITFLLHTLTDFITSRWVSHYRIKENYHNMFVVIGFDQFLHFTQLLLTYNYLTTH